MSPIFRKKVVKTRYMVEPDHVSMLAWLAFSFVLMGLSMLMPSFAAGARSLVLSGISPVFHVVYAPFQAIGSGADNMMKMAQIKSENDKLREENERLLAWYHKAQRLAAENDKLKVVTHKVDEAPLTYVTARIMMDQGQSFMKSALLAGGIKNSIAEGQAVLSNAALAGRIIEAGENVSRVMLLTDANSRVPVMLEKTGQRAILSGKNNATPELLYVPVDAKIKVGSRVVTSGHGGVFPPYIPVGIVSKITKDKRYIVKLFADLDALDLVKIAQYRLEVRLPIARAQNAGIKAMMPKIEEEKSVREVRSATRVISSVDRVNTDAPYSPPVRPDSTPAESIPPDLAQETITAPSPAAEIISSDPAVVLEAQDQTPDISAEEILNDRF